MGITFHKSRSSRSISHCPAMSSLSLLRLKYVLRPFSGLEDSTAGIRKTYPNLIALNMLLREFFSL